MVVLLLRSFGTFVIVCCLVEINLRKVIIDNRNGAYLRREQLNYRRLAFDRVVHLGLLLWSVILNWRTVLWLQVLSDLEAQRVIMITLAVFKFTRNLNARLFSFIFVLNRLIRPALIILHVTILPKLAFLLWQLHRISFMGLGSILFSVVIMIAIVPIAHLIFGNVSIHIPQRL